ncbi:hypothetical protein QBC36DRAFT_340991 [Triangularia setosa]|uniref:Uncharacterized protein n=1 Tax=Triangularia setosa TaxID=2587417 RepID=A0AAN6VW82_9PEZI|nr:hypothetical protein QBC36DRAFT_340991 [Podospora setosa]
MGRYSDQWDWFECDWCCVRGSWGRRPCLLRISRFQETLRVKRETCERVRMENAAKRNKMLPKVYRRAMIAAAEAAEAKGKEVPNSSIRTNTEVSVVGGLNKLDERTPVEVDNKTETDTGTEKVEMSVSPSGLKPTSNSKHYEAEVKKAQKRQAKACTGLKGVIDEGVSLAFDDGDVARIHAANRKAWPRGQVPIAADATAEDREIAELVRRGLIGPEDLRVSHDDFGDDVYPYTVRFVETRKKGRKRSNRPRQGVQVERLALLDAESDWWYLDDEVCAQLLTNGGADLMDGSEFWFMYVD